MARTGRHLQAKKIHSSCANYSSAVKKCHSPIYYDYWCIPPNRHKCVLQSALFLPLSSYSSALCSCWNDSWAGDAWHIALIRFSSFNEYWGCPWRNYEAPRMGFIRRRLDELIWWHQLQKAKSLIRRFFHFQWLFHLNIWRQIHGGCDI